MLAKKRSPQLEVSDVFYYLKVSLMQLFIRHHLVEESSSRNTYQHNNTKMPYAPLKRRHDINLTCFHTRKSNRHAYWLDIYASGCLL